MPKARYEKDADGLYYVFVPTRELRADGYTKYKKLKAKTMAALDEKKQKYEADFALGVIPERVTVDEWFSRWLKIYKSGTAANTQAYYNNQYTNHISPAIGAMQVTAVREIHAQQILTGMASTHAASTVKGVRKILFSLFDAAIRNKLISVNPCEHLTAAGRPPEERRALTPGERAAYLSAIPGDPFGTFAALLYFFGLRRGEALTVRGSDFKDGALHVSRQYVFPNNNAPQLEQFPKTDAGVRRVPIPDAARKYIDFTALPSGLLISASGKPLTYSQVTDRWNAFLARALGPDTDVTMHYLRHNYCTMLFEHDVDLLTVKTVAGHESIETTLRIYTHYTEALRVRSDDKIRAIG